METQFGCLNDYFTKTLYWWTEISHFPNHFPMQRIFWCKTSLVRNLEEENDAILCILKCPAHSFPQSAASRSFQDLRGEVGSFFVG